MPVAVSSTPAPRKGGVEDEGRLMTTWSNRRGVILAKFFATGATALGRLRERNKSEDLPFAFYKICDLQDYGTSQN